VGAYPFEDPQDPRNFRKTIQARALILKAHFGTPVAVLAGSPVPCTVQRIMSVKYSFPSNLHLSRECLDLLSQVFVANPGNRVTLKGLKQHPWFLLNLPDELKARSKCVAPCYP